MSNTDKLQEIKNILDGVTKGVWSWKNLDDDPFELGRIVSIDDNGEEMEVCWFGNYEQYYPTAGNEPGYYDNAIMVNAPSYISWLISQLEQAQAENEQLKADKKKLVEALEQSQLFIQSISDYRGQSLEVANWHQNGDTEPFDNFLEDNGIDDVIDAAIQVLSEVKDNVDSSN